MLTKIIPSYLYSQYYDDLDLQSFVSAQNTLSQEYLDWFNETILPIYTANAIYGNLLDWVGNGIYGVKRPVLQSMVGGFNGDVNTFLLNQIPVNGSIKIGESESFFVNDDIYKRVITWIFFKGDGTQFTIKWLKKRVERFLFGVNGQNLETDQTYRVSVTFGDGNNVNILIQKGLRTYVTGSKANVFAPNTLNANEVVSTYEPYTPIPSAEFLQLLINQGILPVPFQYNFTVSYS